MRIWFLAITAVTLAVFYPSLSHIPRSDQLCYLIQAGQYDDLHSLITKFYSFPRTAEYGGGRMREDQSPKGDNFLFRPFVYIVLGLEERFFGFSFSLWQLFGVVVHLLNLWILLNLLLKIRVSLFAPLSVLCFAVMFIGHEMVTSRQKSLNLKFAVIRVPGIFANDTYLNDCRGFH